MNRRLRKRLAWTAGTLAGLLLVAAVRRQLQADLTRARARVERLFGSRQAAPTVIVCATREAQARYGKGSGLTYYTPVGNYIVLGPEDLAATQDGRLAGKEAEWLSLTNQGQAAPPLSSLETHDQFNAVTRKAMLLSYGTSRREVEGWLQAVGNEGFQELLGALGQGQPFAPAYQAIYSKHR